MGTAKILATVLAIHVITYAEAQTPNRQQRATPAVTVDPDEVWLRPIREANQRGDSETSFKLLLEAARQGKPTAEGMLGLVYLTGEGIQQDDALGMRWLSKGAEDGDLTALMMMGAMYYNGSRLVGGKDLVKARRLYHRAAKSSNEDAQFQYGLMLGRGEGGPQNPPGALYWTYEAVRNGTQNPDAWNDMIVMRRWATTNASPLGTVVCFVPQNERDRAQQLRYTECIVNHLKQKFEIEDRD
jgi:TPR repeat protein